MPLTLYRWCPVVLAALMLALMVPAPVAAFDALIAIGGHDLELADGTRLHPARGSFEVFKLLATSRRADGGVSYQVEDRDGHHLTVKNGDVFERHEVTSLESLRALAKQVSASGWPALESRQVLEGYVDLGMSPAEVTAAWGPPVKVESDSQGEIYHYSGADLVFRGGAVSEIR